MYQTYKFIKTSTAGNRTGFILGKNAYESKKKIMGIILKKVNLEAEQYAFLWEENANCIMNMAGEELSGGAVLASPVILGNYLGKTKVITVGNRLKSEIANKDKNKIYVRTQMPLSMIRNRPQRMKANCLGNNDGYKVDLEGISYFVTREPIQKKKTMKIFKQLDKELYTENVLCLGIIEVDKPNNSKPTVWIKDVGTITAEQGCTTGTISAQLSFPVKNGWWKQPSGESICAKINGEIVIEASVERLSDGNIYINDL
ncbi:MAG: hypothetical protein PHS44_03280 [Candidatus Dojkabacteria bacterium]|jgi:hypothetical protein|nr:hypothetical protein [Candidatus Dojkabacteria bacterium]